MAPQPGSNGPGPSDVSSTTDVSVAGMDGADAEKLQLELPAAVDAGEQVVLAPDVDAVPNGGLKAWLQVVGAFACFLNSWGIINTFGVFQTYYERNLLKDSSPATISWIGSVQGLLLLGCGVVTGPLFDAGFFRALITTGTLLVSFGFMMTSLATQYWHILLAHGFCVGFGAGCLVVPSLAVLPQYFGPTRRALVTGIAVVGSSIGGVLYPLIFTSAASRLGFPWASRLLGFISLGTCALAVALMRTRVKPRRVRSLFDPKAFREKPYMFYCVGMFFSNLGFFVPIFYLQTYALSHGMQNMQNLGLNLISILNGASVLGRLAPSLVVPRIGSLNTMIGVSLMAGTVAFCWIAVDDVAGNVVFAILYGFSSGGIVSLPAVVLASITEDLSFLGARLGTSNFFNAFASLCGPPIAGAIVNAQSGQYLGLQLFAGLAITSTSIFFWCARTARAGPGLRVKV